MKIIGLVILAIVTPMGIPLGLYLLYKRRKSC